MEFLNCCRLCRTSNDSAEPLNHLFAPQNRDLVKQIRVCTGVQLSEGDSFPKWICDRCMTVLDQAYCFRIQCKETDVYWWTHHTLLQQNAQNVKSPLPSPQQVPLPVALMYVKPEVGEVEIEQQPVVKEEPVDEVPEKSEHEVEPELSKTSTKPKAEIIHDERRTKDSSWNKRLQCRFCPKNFGRMCRLREHEKRHTSERTVACLNCSSKFFTEADLRAHMERIHTSDLPHGCDQCGKRFSAKGQLKTHITTHTKRRDFACEVCHKSFKNKYYLKYHVGLHEKWKGKSLENDECDEQTFQDSSMDGDPADHSLE